MRFKVFPKGYDPMVASGPPSEWFVKKWTPEDTARMLELEKQFTIFEGDKPPVGFWSEAIE